MQLEHTQLQEIKLVGLSVRTNKTNEVDPIKGKIGPCCQQFFQQQLPSKINDKVNDGVTYCAYTEYESDHNGDYTYFIGQQVEHYDNVPDGCVTLTIPAQKYAKFTAGPAPIPNVIIDAWQEIWKMQSSDFGGERAYITDFEIYDERAADPSKAVLDLFVGIK